jgi:CheY-like chemotaxis protein
VRLYLPRAEPGQAAAAPPAHVAPARPAHQAILVVEDDADVRRVVARQIADLGYSVMEAQNPKEAMAILTDSGKRIDLLFTDLVMPGGMNGHELARAALAERPGLAVLFTSGYSGTALRSEARLKEGEHFLSKPYRKDDLARTLREIFAH